MTTPQSGGRGSVQRIFEDLRHRIEAGHYPTPGRLPSKKELADEFNVSPETIRKVSDRLKDAGLVSGQQGVGLWIRVRRLTPWMAHTSDGASPAAAWQAEVTAAGAVPALDLPVTSVERAPDQVAEQLRLDKGAFAVVRRTLRRVDGEPVQIADHWFPRDLAMDSLLMEAAHLPSIEEALRSIGRPQVSHVDRVWSALATPEEAKRLGMKETTATATTRRTRVGFDGEGRPIRFSLGSARGDSEVLVYELPG
ncbi:GntR family transcriptional regulator [Streptacidiphilus sp. EB103A]|uniref:GntR family transcriptional regulator n=1 Tax=Streptacidiphilus sp. EB103A TaxID=3156275 RepID=UPI003513887C